MTSLTALVRRHPAAAYFALTFAISWAGVLLVIGGPSGIPGTTADNDSLFPAVLLAMLAGPSIAGPVLTGIVRGKRGCRELVARLLTWHVDVRWYAVALLTAPAIAIAVLLVLSRLSPEFVPRIAVTSDKAVFVLFALTVACGAGFPRGAGLDRIRHSRIEAPAWRSDHRNHRRAGLERLALARNHLGHR